MKKLLFFLGTLMLLNLCCQNDDNTTVPDLSPPGQVNFSDLKIGQKSLYQRYSIGRCDNLSDSFRWQDDTLILEVISEGTELFLRESAIFNSQAYIGNTFQTQYPVSIIDEGVLITERSASKLFRYYPNDTLRLNPVYEGTTEQLDCVLWMDSSLFFVAHLPEFELGEISYTDKSVINGNNMLNPSYLIYDNEKVFTRYKIFVSDAPLYTSADGWDLIEE